MPVEIIAEGSSKDNPILFKADPEISTINSIPKFFDQLPNVVKRSRYFVLLSSGMCSEEKIPLKPLFFMERR
jgi:hypothetical protein